ncbi:alpha/beta hydrolase [Francisella sp. LA112445]|uniref:alpha/beta fold hydrolase n=1 Tax=Francisella sp. LA112445 TaxID=1395624 RepID=UPI001788E2A8|nr:alpha/beta hydrolase [Francisella sp. LA112445]QIW09351.1 alpha/beta hydrolase [Francisella sp. LA112445]
MPKVRINDINMYYEERGCGHPIVLVGGFGADNKAWGEFANKLTLDYRVIVFDNRGVGQTDCPDEPYSIAQMAQDVKSLCDYLKIEKTIVIGSSMGGFIVQQLMYDYPKLCEKAIILNSAIKTSRHYSVFMQAFYKVLAAGVLEPQIVTRLFLPWVYSDDFLRSDLKVEKLVELVITNPHPFSLIGFKNQRCAVEGFNSSKWIAKVEVPTLVVAGEKDIVFYESDVRRLSELLRNSEYYKFRNTGHLPHIERPNELLNVVTDFISD